MPYRYAHYFVGFVLLVIMTGFWMSYFAVAGSVPLAFHVHAISSMTWLALLIAQHLTIHRRANGLHRQMGRASFALFPFLILGFMMIINVTAERYSAAENEFIMLLGPSFWVGMAIAIAAYLTLFYLALKHRRNIKLHAGYMLATPLILFESPFSRVMDAYLPWMNFIGSEGPRNVLDTIVISDGMVTLFALGLYAMNRKHGAPWLVAAGFTSFQAVAMWFAPDLPAIGRAFGAYAAVPAPAMLALGVAAGAAAAWLGWEAGKAPAKPAAQPA
ncbi:hypothetical protein [Porphyrobacter sp. LM 6]|uniref:hypothetical protein n=1 Tax=Porphyrobacter sp. LM 6 TaxID=1896196 RepID=UPI000846C397|nr:hypothetical protein [Porphyrobacter sp. LM 6]AOL93484.1 hypothetical protein BG023_11531 [Porphyrobacter sp. LM 6]